MRGTSHMFEPVMRGQHQIPRFERGGMYYPTCSGIDPRPAQTPFRVLRGAGHHSSPIPWNARAGSGPWSGQLILPCCWLWAGHSPRHTWRCPVATKKFSLHTEPHVAEIGDELAFEFQPEVDGDAFLDSYDRLKERYAGLQLGGSDLDSIQTRDLREAISAVRAFLASLMLPASAARFEGTKLPNRIIMQLLEWAMEIYGGGRPPTSSGGSATTSALGGTPGTGPSRSKG